MKKIILLLTSGLLFFPLSARAVCPVCTIAVAAGLGLSRWLGIDDTIAGVWVGGVTVSLIIWTINYLHKKNIHAWWWQILTIVGYYLLIVYPLFYYKIIGHPLNTLWGVDKLLLGIIIGSIFFTAGALLYGYLKKKNNGHAHFPFEKVVLPIAPLIILSGIFYFLTR